MSIVADSSTLVAALLDAGTDGVWAEHVVTERPLCAPELALVEATNILRRLELARRISSAEANSAQEDLLQLEMELFPYEPFADRIWDLRRTVTSYDAWYVALAEALAVPLATLDRRLARSNGPRCEFLTPGS